MGWLWPTGCSWSGSFFRVSPCSPLSFRLSFSCRYLVLCAYSCLAQRASDLSCLLIPDKLVFPGSLFQEQCLEVNSSEKLITTKVEIVTIILCILLQDKRWLSLVSKQKAHHHFPYCFVNFHQETWNLSANSCPGYSTLPQGLQ